MRYIRLVSTNVLVHVHVNVEDTFGQAPNRPRITGHPSLEGCAQQACTRRDVPDGSGIVHVDGSRVPWLETGSVSSQDTL